MVLPNQSQPPPQANYGNYGVNVGPPIPTQTQQYYGTHPAQLGYAAATQQQYNVPAAPRPAYDPQYTTQPQPPPPQQQWNQQFYR